MRMTAWCIFFKLTCRCADHDQVDTQQLVQTMSNIGRRKMLRYQRRARGKSSKTNDSVTHERPKIKKECPRFIISGPGNKRAKSRPRYAATAFVSQRTRGLCIHISDKRTGATESELEFSLRTRVSIRMKQGWIESSIRNWAVGERGKEEEW